MTSSDDAPSLTTERDKRTWQTLVAEVVAIVTGLAAADAINALGMCDVIVTEAARDRHVASLSNQLRCSQDTAATAVALVLWITMRKQLYQTLLPSVNRVSGLRNL